MPEKGGDSVLTPEWTGKHSSIDTEIQISWVLTALFISHLLNAEATARTERKHLAGTAEFEQAFHYAFINKSYCYMSTCLQPWHLRQKFQFWSPHWLQTSLFFSPIFQWFWLMTNTLCPALHSQVSGDNRVFYCYFRCRNLPVFQPSCLPWGRIKYMNEIHGWNRGFFYYYYLLKCALAELLLPTAV